MKVNGLRQSNLFVLVITHIGKKEKLHHIQSSVNVIENIMSPDKTILKKVDGIITAFRLKQ